MEVQAGYRIHRRHQAGKRGAFFFQGHPEIYEHNILNPGEDMQVVIKLSPSVSENTTNLVTVVTPNGAKSQITFGW